VSQSMERAGREKGADEMSERTNAPVCPTHGLRMIDVRGAGHMHPDGSEHGCFTYGCPHVESWDYARGMAVRCAKESTVTIRCPEEKKK